MDWLTKRLRVLDSYVALFQDPTIVGPFQAYWEEWVWDGAQFVPLRADFARAYRSAVLARARQCEGLTVRETPDGFLLSRPLPAAPTP